MSDQARISYRIAAEDSRGRRLNTSFADDSSYLMRVNTAQAVTQVTSGAGRGHWADLNGRHWEPIATWIVIDCSGKRERFMVSPALRPVQPLHDKAFASVDGLVCDCGEAFAGDDALAALNLHTVRTYNDPSEMAIQLRGHRVIDWHEVLPDPEPRLEQCERVACSNIGNRRGCWTVHFSNGQPDVHELPTAQAGLELAYHGGRVSRTYLHRFC